MSITIEEKFIQDALFVLNEIQAELISSKDNSVRYTFIKDDKAPKEREQLRIIHWLKNACAVDILGDVYDENSSVITFHFLIKPPVIGKHLNINGSIFSEIRRVCEADLNSKTAKEILDKVERIGKAKSLETQKLERVRKQIDIKPFIDEESNSVIFQGKRSDIPAGNQWVICKELFKKPAGDWVKENDVIELFNRDGKQSFYDAQRLLNARIKEDLGIKDFIEYSTAKARINPETIDKLNHSEK